MISRDQVPAVKLPEEEMHVDALGDTVLVRGLGFSKAMQFAVSVRAGDSTHVAHLLSETVLAADLEPLYSEAEWEAFGNEYAEQMVELYKAARRLSGLDAEDAEKK